MIFPQLKSATFAGDGADIPPVRPMLRRKVVSLAIYLAVAGMAGDATSSESKSFSGGGVRDAEDYGGIVINQTVTVAGHDFYNYFVAAWRDRDLGDRYSVSVHERPSPRWGSQVWIEYAQRRVFQVSLPGGRAGIRLLGEQAAEIAVQRIVEIDVQRLLFREADFGLDEI